jgi:hypothetical protein
MKSIEEIRTAQKTLQQTLNDCLRDQHPELAVTALYMLLVLKWVTEDGTAVIMPNGPCPLTFEGALNAMQKDLADRGDLTSVN